MAPTDEIYVRRRFVKHAEIGVEIEFLNEPPFLCMSKKKKMGCMT